MTAHVRGLDPQNAESRHEIAGVDPKQTSKGLLVGVRGQGGLQTGQCCDELLGVGVLLRLEPGGRVLLPPVGDVVEDADQVGEVFVVELYGLQANVNGGRIFLGEKRLLY